MTRLLENPLDYPRIVVTETEVVIQGGKTMGLTRLLHFVQLRNLELVILDDTPVVLGRIEWKARRQSPVSADD